MKNVQCAPGIIFGKFLNDIAKCGALIGDWYKDVAVCEERYRQSTSEYEREVSLLQSTHLYVIA